MQTNGHAVSVVRLFMCPLDGQCPTVASAERQFGSDGAPDGSGVLTINTDEFSVAGNLVASDVTLHER